MKTFDDNILVNKRFFNNLVAERKRLLNLLIGIRHHNDAVKPQYKLPESLTREIDKAIAWVTA